jgi:hypothetical protein
VRATTIFNLLDELRQRNQPGHVGPPIRVGCGIERQGPGNPTRRKVPHSGTEQRSPLPRRPHTRRAGTVTRRLPPLVTWPTCATQIFFCVPSAAKLDRHHVVDPIGSNLATRPTDLTQTAVTLQHHKAHPTPRHRVIVELDHHCDYRPINPFFWLDHVRRSPSTRFFYGPTFPDIGAPRFPDRESCRILVWEARDDRCQRSVGGSLPSIGKRL